VNLDTPQPPPGRNLTLFRIETPAVDDTPHVDPSGIDAFGSEAPEPAPHAPAETNHTPSRQAGSLVRAFAALALVEALVIAGLLINRSSVFDTPAGRLVIESDPPGADVWLDGRHLGMTPLTLMSDAGERSLRIDAQGTSRTMKIAVANGQVTHARVDFVRVQAAVSAAPIPSAAPVAPPELAPQPPVREGVSALVRAAATDQSVERGWIDVPAVVALDVYEDRLHLGNTASGRLRLPSGIHALEFVNDELGVRVRSSAVVRPGKVTRVILRYPDLRERGPQVRVAKDTPAQIAVDLQD
jgi:hypothetical protein